ncbi:tumor necrosis factor receptor superfamily member 5 isoform X2 [Triplophysa dalaica]|uniref:tumor necrosis factor receptor superfamily member 5 isoform X2 n=1 Tax=Triplophysa dalaica TaxID=1582913 RepID=UPI0024E032A2|nr:tumor necrosis factor receptor superfamily member 5 isoform X2 [Triplophysa dalaica]
MLTLLSIFLLLSHVLSLGQSLDCDERIEYKGENRCCKKCRPGESMKQRCSGQSETKCNPCNNGYYNDNYNNDYLVCKNCKGCYKEHMKVERNCTLTSDAVCTCEDGFRCSDIKCETCVKVQTPVPTKLPVSTDMDGHVNGSCQHQPLSVPPKRETLNAVSAQKRRRYQCQCRRCVKRHWRMSEKDRSRRPRMRVWLEYLY